MNVKIRGEELLTSQRAGVSLGVLGAVAVLGVIALVANPLLAASIALILMVVVLAVSAPRVAIPVIIAYLAFMSSLRRVLEYYAGDLGGVDVLLLVGPAAALSLAYVASVREGGKPRSPLGSAMLLLLVISVVGAFNPLQGPPAVGVVGFMFFGVPLLWFWVGRRFVDDQCLGWILRTVGYVAVVTAVYGIAQAAGWMSPWDALWVETVDFRSLRAVGEVKPFSTFVSPGEFARYMSMGLLLWIVGSRWSKSPGAQRAFVVLILGLLAVALIVPSVRIAILLTAVGAGVLLASRWKIPPMRALVAGIVALLVLVFAANAVQRLGVGGGPLLDRVIEGIADPIAGDATTFDKRSSMFADAIEAAATNPLGEGTGVTTLAAREFGGTIQNAEADVGDVAFSWGVPGLLTYLVVLMLGARTAYVLAVKRQDWLGFGVLAVLSAAGIQWINGGLYAIAPIVWLCLGWADRRATA